jgi:RNA polymerase sigma-70 factor (ECF subfamily)
MSTLESLAQTFVAAAGSPAVQLGSDLDVALSQYLAAARAPWPDFGIAPLEFARYLGERCAGGELPPAEHAADLWLACACARGVPAAVERFQREYEPLIARIAARRGAAQDIAADVRQQLCERLLVPDPGSGRRAKIGDYRGSGALRSWVASAAATTLLSVQRAASRRRERSEPEPQDAALLGRLDPELEYLKQRYTTQVHDAVVAAIEALSPRDKALLRLHLGERLSIDALGTMYGVNRATAARWLATARESLRRGTVKDLRGRLRLEPRECDSLIALVNSQLDISVLRHLEHES